MKTLSEVFMGYATLGFIPVLLTEGKTQIILLIVQIVCLLLGILFYNISKLD